MKHKTLSLFVLLLACSASHAQFYTGIHAGATLPSGDYAASQMSDNEWLFSEGSQRFAGAGIGWDAGLDLSFALPFHPSLEVVLDADYMQSNMNRDVRDYYALRYQQRYSQCSQYEMQLPQFRHLAVLGGLRYCFPMTRIIDFYGEALAGVNTRWISDWHLAFADETWLPGDGQQFDQYNNESLKQYTTRTTFALALGTGFLIKKHVTLGMRFYLLGTANLSWDATETIRYNIYGAQQKLTNTAHVDSYPVNPHLFLISLGYRLNPFRMSRHVQDY